MVASWRGDGATCCPILKGPRVRADRLYPSPSSLMSKLSSIGLALSCMALTAPSASADLISWGAVQDATGPAEVSQTGTLVAAKNCWSSAGGAVSPVVGGVTFDAFAPLGWNGAGWTLMAGSASGDAGYDSMLDDARACSVTASNPTGWGGVQLDSVAGLTIGKQYEIQVWFCDQRTGSPTNVLYDRVMTCSSATGPGVQSSGIITNLGVMTQGTLSGGLDADPNNTAGAGDTVFGQYVIGTFTRTSADPLWLLIQGSHPLATNVLVPHLNAFQIRELPSYTSFCAGDGSATACPCGNAGGPGEGCANSSGAGAVLSASGSPSVAADDLGFTGSKFVAGQPGLLFSANNAINGGAGVLFGDGLRCAGGFIQRLGVVAADGNGDMSWGSGFAAAGGWTSGDTRRFQGWYRDPSASPCGSGFNLSQGIEVTFTP